MAGIYIHIPFCVQRCHYCDFFSSTSLDLRKQFVNACLKEIELRADYLDGKESDTIYLGGGTPSLLDADSLDLILNKLYKHLNISSKTEITIEANPDDLSSEVLANMKSLGFNRISLGIQSFRDIDLLFMNRRHTADQAINSIRLAEKSGFQNISVDLIYGLDALSDKAWMKNLMLLKDFHVNHLSAYHLTIEPETVFGRWHKAGKIQEMKEGKSLNQYNTLRELSAELGFEHYEISNFAKNKKYSRHNTKYWKGEWYLGIGPSAHSFNGKSRHWNPSDLQQYIDGYLTDCLITKQEDISEIDRRNELIMTRLRTKWGIKQADWETLNHKQSWGEFVVQCQKYLISKDMILKNNMLSISVDSWFRADGIIADLFSIE
ncbi:MAG: radical SAM family heme chaperone HemW [Bacteroidales bacterium]|nr:radical SAM family heme chaperone HemW [Bacteroidales bacterium]